MQDFLGLFGTMHDFRWVRPREKENEAHARYCKFDDFKTQLELLNSQGFHIYFTINETDGNGRKEENIVRVRSYFLDLDTTPYRESDYISLPPTAVVQTSTYKHHLYWLVVDGRLETFPQVQVALAQKFGGDITVKDLPRVARVPGFLNHKYDDPFYISIKTIEPSRIYTEYQVVSGLSLDLDAAIAKTTKKVETIEVLKENPKSEGERHQELVRQARKYAAVGLNRQEIKFILLAANATFNPPIPENRLNNEVERILNAVTEYEGGQLGGLITFDKPKPVKKTAFIPDKFALSAPGLLGEMVSSISKASNKGQPALALQSALCVLSTVKGGNYKFRDKQAVGIYTFGVAPTGAGKNYGLMVADGILQEIGRKDCIMGTPASQSAVLKALSRSPSGTTIAIQDEIGKLFDRILNSRDPNAPGLLSVLLQAYSNRNLHGMEYSARSGHGERIDATNANLTILGVSTPESLFRSIKQHDVYSGFIPRFIMFYPEKPDPYLEKVIFDEESSFDEGLLEAIKEQGLPGQISLTQKKLAFSSAQRKRVEELFIEWDKKIHTDNLVERGVYTRAGENFIKVLIAMTNHETVTDVDIDWSAQLIDYSCVTMIDKFDKFSAENIVDENHKRVLHIISHGDGMTKNEITRKTQFLSKSQREEILMTLQEAEQIKAEIRMPLKGRTKTVYVAI